MALTKEQTEKVYEDFLLESRQNGKSHLALIELMRKNFGDKCASEVATFLYGGNNDEM